ncbi:hypothetical protein [Kitasatospora sp. NPDC056531]|uniref:hypothetical protein n=1 Tax=Kitasatospora sp. NPDC056531 TaxID=3345856 RepID=UPI0036884B77
MNAALLGAVSITFTLPAALFAAQTRRPLSVIAIPMDPPRPARSRSSRSALLSGGQ